MSGVVLLPGFADEAALLQVLTPVLAAAPFRTMQTPNGGTMSVAMSNCGDYGWVSDSMGYCYARHDPLTGTPWPRMPAYLSDLAARAAARAGFGAFVPDACLINRYPPGSRLGAHQDRNEASYDWPIVSVSLGVPATFQIFGPTRAGKAVNIPLSGGDILVFGGPARLYFHGIKQVKGGSHPLTGDCRLNLTFRRAGYSK